MSQPLEAPLEYGRTQADKLRVKVAGGLAQGTKGLRTGSLVLRDKAISLEETENDSGVC